MTAPDREGLSVLRLGVVAAATGAALGSSVTMVPREVTAFGMPVVIVALAGAAGVVLLRSFAVRNVVRALVGLSVALVWLMGDVSSGAAPTTSALGWLALCAASLVLGSSITAAATASRATAIGVTATDTVATPGTATGSNRGLVSSLGAAGVVALLVVGGAMVLAPAVAGTTSGEPSLGSLRDLIGGSNARPMAATRRLDMTTRPRLTDAMVMTVGADRPAFWRLQTFEHWDGTAWSVDDATPESLPSSGEVEPDEFDLAATAGVDFEQDFEIIARYATSLPAAATPVRVDLPTSGSQLADGTLLTDETLGAKARYSVVSRQVPVTAESLRAAPAVEATSPVAKRYAAPPEATDRVRRLAAEITKDAATQYDKVRAIEDWMGAQVEYSLDAPLSPAGVDVVDHFLFDAKQGWCEQISSSLVVLLRLNGVPAREAVGYAPGERDPVSGRFKVRERDAHAWAEVWFEGIGWVPFDPTAQVPLAGESEPASSAWFTKYGGWLLLVIGLCAVSVGVLARAAKWTWAALVRLARRVFGRTRGLSGRAGREGHPWESEMDRRLRAVGDRWGRRWSDTETTTAFTRALAERTGVDDVASVGRLVDRGRYGAVPMTDDEAAEAIGVLESVAAGPMDSALVGDGERDGAGSGTPPVPHG